MKIFETIRTANHNLFRNKVRTLLTIIAIFVGSFTIILNVAINSGVNAFIDEQVASVGGEDFIIILPAESEQTMSSMMASSDPQEFTEANSMSAVVFTDEQIEELKNIDGLDGDSFFSPKSFQGSAYVKSSKNSTRWSMNKADVLPPGKVSIPLTAGTLTDDQSDKFQIILEPKYAQALGYENDEDIIGETITLGFQDAVTLQIKEFPVEVVGVQASGIISISSGSYVSHALFDELYAYATRFYPEDYEAPTMYVMASFDTSKYSETEIKDLLKDKGYLAVTVSDMMGLIRTFFDAILVVFSIFGGIALLAAAIGIVNTLLMSVEERTREIGLSKALGMSSGRIFAEFSTEAILLGFWGSIFGVAVAMGIGLLVNSVVHQPGMFLEALPTFQLFRFSFETIAPIVCVVMLIAFVAGTAPAIKAARKNPIDALRYE